MVLHLAVVLLECARVGTAPPAHIHSAFLEPPQRLHYGSRALAVVSGLFAPGRSTAVNV